ncbi:MAG: hypothetical protein N2Z70_00095 [Bdellovibrionaceae bacterium]|jgi:hypothetical protein|nr:hypothetical protein [Pseudobdellovibrionaceae bacterium]
MKISTHSSSPWVVCLSFFLFLIHTATPTWALDAMTKFLVHFETKGNNVSVRDSKPLPIEHFEIPLDLVDMEEIKTQNPKIKKHLIFQRDGRSYLRWIINPEDTKFAGELYDFFKQKHGIELKKGQYFTGYQTSSRSYIVESPDQEVSFSVKVSTNKTGGNWQDKKQEFKDAVDAVRASEWIDQQERILRFENVIFLKEPLAFGIKGLDQGMVIRDLDVLQSLHKQKGYFYIPAFTLVHTDIGPWIAQKNGFMHPDEFVARTMIPAVARAVGESFWRLGIELDSPHAQNFLLEFDKNLKPTGRVVMRDLSDLRYYKEYLIRLHPRPLEFIKNFSEPSNIVTREEVRISFGPLHGNTFPFWVNEQVYEAWGKIFALELFQYLTLKTQKPMLENWKRLYNRNGQYLVTELNLFPKDWPMWQNMVRYKNPAGLYNCSYVWLAP